jgi:exodeoxyribonuclease V alpha subunit
MYFSGKVNALVYEDNVKAFYIMKMLLDDTKANEIVTVKGNVSGLPVKIGSWFGFEADWVNHPKFGKQLAITKAPIFKNQLDPDSVENALIAHGVGGRVVKLIRMTVGDESFLRVLGDQQALELEVPTIDTFTAAYIVKKWQMIQAYFRTLSFLCDLDLPEAKVSSIWSTFGDDAEKILSSDPWALVQIEGVTFVQADAIAMKLGLPPQCPERTRGVVLYVCKNQKTMGHLYSVSGQIYQEAQEYIPNITMTEVAGALVYLNNKQNIVLDKTTKAGITAIYEPWFCQIEKESAEELLDRKKTAIVSDKERALNYSNKLASVGPKTEKLAKRKKRFSLDKVVETAIDEWESQVSLSLSNEQKQGVKNALIEPVSVLTGLPGTGKTMSLKAVVNILKEAGISFLLCAPTGIAAKNLANVTGLPAHTIHRAFSAQGSSDEKRESSYTGITGRDSGADLNSSDSDWGYSKDQPHPAEVLILDEASMLDQHLLYRVLDCTSSSCRIVFVGDAAQLPSVGPGNVLRDLIASGRFPVVSLTSIFRQKDTSDIVFAAHDIFHGKMPDLQIKSDFSLVEISDEGQVLEFIKQMSSKLYDKRANFQVLSPRHSGTVGVTNINDHLRNLLNPRRDGLVEIKLGGDTVREDDRIMVFKNKYKLDVFNGDVGKISSINTKVKEVEVKIFGETPLFIKIPYKDVPGFIRLAYACTVHKAQGLEYDFIIMPIVDSFRHQLQRNLLYTAVTRAKKKVILVGTRTALQKAILNDKEDMRRTLLKERLT